MILDAVIKASKPEILWHHHSPLTDMEACSVALYQMLQKATIRDMHVMTAESAVITEHLLYLLDVERQPICFHCYSVYSTAFVKFTQDVADKKARMLALQENPKASISWAKAILK